jgi:hypothetical protein
MQNTNNLALRQKSPLGDLGVELEGCEAKPGGGAEV